MKNKLLAAAASVAFIATGVAAMAQEAQKHDQRPAAAEQKAGGAMHEQGAQAQMERREQPGAEAAKPDARAEGQPNEMKGQGAERPRAAEAQDKDRKTEPGQNRAAEETRPQTPPARTGANEMERNGAKTGTAETERRNEGAAANERDRNAPRTAEQNAPRGPAQVRGNVHMSSEHASRVSETLRRDMRPERVNVDVRVGTRVPETVTIRPLPPEVIAIVPEYRGYDYFIDENDEIVFVSPQSHEIVGMIDYEGRAASDDVTHVRAARPCPPEE